MQIPRPSTIQQRALDKQAAAPAAPTSQPTPQPRIFPSAATATHEGSMAAKSGVRPSAAPGTSTSSPSPSPSPSSDPLAQRRQGYEANAQAFANRHPRVDDEAASYAARYMKKNFGLEVKDPQHTYLNEYEPPSGGTYDPTLNTTHYEQSPSSLPPGEVKASASLPDLFKNNFNDNYHQEDFAWPTQNPNGGWDLDRSKHQGIFGLSTSNASNGQKPPGDTVIDPRQEKPLDPGHLFQKMTAAPKDGGADFPAAYQQSLQEFYEKEGASHTSLTRERAQINLEDQRRSGSSTPQAQQQNVLTPADFSMVQNAFDPSHPGSSGANADTHVYPLDVEGKSSANALRIQGGDGRTVLYLPEETQPYHAFDDNAKAQQWMEHQNSAVPGWGERFAGNYFSTTDRQGLDSGKGVTSYLKNQVEPDTTHAVQQSSADRNYLRGGEDISADPFGRQTQRQGQQEMQDAHYALTTNTDRSNKQWMKATGLISYVGGAVALGLGKTAQERGAGSEGLFTSGVRTLGLSAYSNTLKNR